jgi:hypothetical protein
VKTFALRFALFSLSLGTPILSRAQNADHCPKDAVFLALGDQIRGYPARANGLAAPCQVLEGPKTLLGGLSGLAISRHGDLHAINFLNGQNPEYYTLFLFTPESHGDSPPERGEALGNTDFNAIAIDSRINHFVLTEEASPAFEVSLNHGDGNSCEYYFDLGATYGWSSATRIAIDHDDNLVVGGYDSNGNALISTFGTAANLCASALLRTISGPKTGLLPLVAGCCGGNSLSVAVDPDYGELYVYSSSNGQQEISIFLYHANGDVKPVRVIAGPHTLIGPPSAYFAGKIAVAPDGRVFVAEANNRTSFLHPGPNGDVAPAQIIQDWTIGSSQIAQGSIAVHSCDCVCSR